jgi:hypothetical protein
VTRLYHFSEDPTIECFRPRSAAAAQDQALVWAVAAERAYLYYFPRDCPRVTFYQSERTTPEDRKRFFAHATASRVAAIEASWMPAMQSTRVYRYELPRDDFELQDEIAGYWVSGHEVVPLRVEPVGDLVTALTTADVEVRIMPSLWPLYEAVVASSLEFSIIRWRNVAPRSAGTAL